MYLKQICCIEVCLWILLHCSSEVFASCYQVNPSEYAYHDMPVKRFERTIANCRNYPMIGNTQGVNTEEYIHCNGTQLRLADSEQGILNYSSSDYYVWLAGSSASQLLFILPKLRANLTTITLHYYSDNIRGLPRLRFYAVPDDFEVWDAPTSSYSYVDVPAAAPPDGRPAGHRNVSKSFNSMTSKVLLYKHRNNNFAFAVNEVEFFSCDGNAACMRKNITTTTQTLINSVTFEDEHTVGKTQSPHTTFGTSTMPASKDSRATFTTITAKPESHLLIGVVTTVSMLAFLLTIIATVSLILFWRKKAKQNKVDNDSSYSTLCRGAQQMQPQSVHTSNELYDQIQLSPSTGQAEFISRNETTNTNNPPPHQTEHDIHPSVDKDKPKSGKLKIAASTVSSLKENKLNTPEQPTYAVVNKRMKYRSNKETKHRHSQYTAAQTQNVSVVEFGNQVKQSQNSLEADAKLAPQIVESLQDLYSVVKEKPKERPVEDDNHSSIPTYTVEELYTAVKKVPKTKTSGDEEVAPQIPPHTIDELYTAVQKKPKASDSKDEEAPPIPTHTVEELYTAVMKMPKDTIEEIPRVPPHRM